MEWYYAKDGNQQGPITMAQLRQLASSGKLEPTDMVFKTGMKDWVEASTVAGLFAAAKKAPAPAPEGGFDFGEEGEKVAASPRRKPARDRVEREEEGEDEEEAPRSRARSRSGSIPFLDYILFQRTIQEWALPAVFWAFVLYGLYQAARVAYMVLKNISYMTFGGFIDLLGSLLAGIVGLLALRLSFEVMRAIFRIQEALAEDKNRTDRPQDE